MSYNKDDDDDGSECLKVVVLEKGVWEGEWKSAMLKISREQNSITIKCFEL